MRNCRHHVGVDEAGLGPNLGPLVIVATRWTGLECHTDDLWKRFQTAVTQQADGKRLHIGDSKSVYRSKKDFGSLERSARGILAAAGIDITGLSRLVGALDCNARVEETPWLCGVDDGPVDPVCNRLAELLEQTGGKLDIAATFVTAKRFNQELAQSDSKGHALSRLSLRTLRQVWTPDDEPTAVWCDKHGGRNRYDDLLLEHCEGAFVIRHDEGRERSSYTVGASEIVFGVKSEKHFPVACASLVAKYLRQRAMRAFNAWWAERVPGLKPTEGYPQDAKRFRDDVAHVREKLAVPEDTFWRKK